MQFAEYRALTGKNMRQWLIKAVLKHLLRKKSGDRIPTGTNAQIDCYTIYINNSDGTYGLLVDEVSAYGVTGKYWYVDQHVHGASLPLEFINFDDIEVHQYYKKYHFIYESLLKYLIQVWRRYLWVLFDILKQSGFNKRSLRLERMHILDLLVKNHIEGNLKEINEFSLMDFLYSRRWQYRPDIKKQLNYHRFFLDSLEKSGDLEKDHSGLRYNVSAKALLTISEYEIEERRHKDNISQQKRIGYLTFALIIVVILQTVVTYAANCENVNKWIKSWF